jgi:hypothetical protein
MQRSHSLVGNVRPKINAKNEYSIVTALTTLHASLARLETQSIHSDIGKEQDRWCEIDATGFFHADKDVLRELYEREAMKDFTIMLQGGETLKINSFFASMISEPFRTKLTTLVGHEGPRMTYTLTHVRRDLLEKLISLMLSDTFRVHPSEIKDLTFLANELRFPAPMRAGLDQEMQRVLDLDTDAIEREVESIYQETKNESARRARLVQPTEPFPTLWGLEDKIFKSSSELILGHYYGISENNSNLYRFYVFCGINPNYDELVYAKSVPANTHLYMPSFKNLKHLVSFDHVRPKTKYPPGDCSTQPLSNISWHLRQELTGRFCRHRSILTPKICLLLGYKNDERVHMLYDGRVHLVDIEHYLLIQTSEEPASEDELNRAWLAVSTVPPPPQTYHNRTPIQDEQELIPGRYYGCMLETLGITYYRNPQSPLYFGNIMRVLYLGKAPESDRLYVLFDDAQHTIPGGGLYLPDVD